MEYKNENLGCSFTLPDKLTVRQQLAFWQRFGEMGEGEPNAVRNWEAGKALITNWTCEIMPKLDASLDEMTDPKQARVIAWAGKQITQMLISLDELSPNS